MNAKVSFDRRLSCNTLFSSAYFVTAEECLKELYNTGAPDESGSGLELPANGTCEWIEDESDSPDLRSWRNWKASSRSEILLLTGDIGTGKSTLALRLVKTLRISPSSNSRSVVACFCKFQGEDTSKTILRCLLYGLAMESIVAKRLVVQHREHYSNSGSGRPLDAFRNFDSLGRCLKECVKSRERELCLVIDGLDQCPEGSLGVLIDLFEDLISADKLQEMSFPLKLLFLSRPRSTITELLSAYPRLELLDVRRPGEARRIIEYLVGPKLFKTEADERNKLITMLEEKSDNCIQWAKLVLEHLKRTVATTFALIARELRQLSMGNGLDHTYLTLFERNFTKEERDYADSALRLVAAAVRPLTVEELAGAMVVNPLDSEVASEEALQKEANVGRIHTLQPFVRITTQGSTITMHNTLRDLILRTSHLDPSRELHFDKTDPSQLLHRTMAKTCLEFLLLPYFRRNIVVSENDYEVSIYDEWARGFALESPKPGDATSSSTQEPSTRRSVGPAFFAYASECWAHHLSSSDQSVELISKAIDLSKPGSTQCANWWTHLQFRSPTGINQSTQMTPLLAAVYFGHAFIVIFIIRDAETAGQELTTYDAMTLAIEREDLTIFNLLHNATPGHELRTNGLWHLRYALDIKNAHIRKSIFDTLIKDPSVRLTQRGSRVSHGGRTILAEIATRGDITSLDSLLQCLEGGKRDDMIALLNDEGDAAGCSPLWHAISYGHTDIVNALCGLDLDLINTQLRCPGRFGEHVVATAARAGDRSMMTTLLKVCPDYADRPCPGSSTPLAFAYRNSDHKAAEIAETLLATGIVGVDHPDEYNSTPLMGAFRSGKIELCKVLIRHGADIGRVFSISSQSVLACQPAVSTGFPGKDKKMLETLMELGEVKALSC